MRTFGAVVLTLNATGWGLWFVMVKERLTRVVSGPVGRHEQRQGPEKIATYFESQGRWRD